MQKQRQNRRGSFIGRIITRGAIASNIRTGADVRPCSHCIVTKIIFFLFFSLSLRRQCIV